jgi:uroporphyrinogen decarboxylase
MRGEERLLRALRRAPVDATPAWFMRQSGGSMPGYGALRERHSVLEIARSPVLAAQVALEAADRLGTDGAVLFADIMLPVEAMGVALELTAEGPVLERPVRTADDVARLRGVECVDDLGFVPETVSLVRAGLDGRAAVIGIAGGPFTLAGYMIEGRPSRDHLAAKRVAFGEPALWAALLDRITDVSIAYVTAQIAAGAQVVQVFDSWAGALAPADYDLLVAPWTRRLLDAIRGAGGLSIHFAAAGSAILERLADRSDAVGVDSTQSLVEARRRVPSAALQGNMDPARVVAGWAAIGDGVDRVLAEAGGGPGHVFNLGHALPRSADPGILADIVDLVHQRTAGRVGAVA